MLDKGLHIDNLFKEAAENSGQQMPAYTWDIISERLSEKKKRKLFIYLQAVAASFAIIAAFIAGSYFSDHNNTNISMQNTKCNILLNKNQKTVNSNYLAHLKISSNNESKKSLSLNTSQNKSNKINYPTEEIFKNTAANKFYTEKNKKENNLNSSNDTPDDTNKLYSIHNDKLNAEKIKKEIISISENDIINQPDNKLDDIPDDKQLAMNNDNKWLFGGDISSGFLTNGIMMKSANEADSYNTISYQTETNDNYDFSLPAYALSFTAKYKLKKRLSLQSGISYILFDNSDKLMEIPLTLHYRIIDKKIGFEPYLGTGNGILNTTGTNDYNATTIFGLSTDYSINKNIMIHISPVYKFLLPVENNYYSRYYKNYFGINTGLLYKF